MPHIFNITYRKNSFKSVSAFIYISLKTKKVRTFYLLWPNDRKSDAKSLYPVAKEQRCFQCSIIYHNSEKSNTKSENFVMVIWTLFADRRIRRTFFLLIIIHGASTMSLRWIRRIWVPTKFVLCLKRFCLIIFEKWVAKLLGFAIINAWQHFGNRKSVNQNNWCNWSKKRRVFTQNLNKYS